MTSSLLTLFAGMVLGGAVCSAIAVFAWKRRRIAGGLLFLLLSLLLFMSALSALLFAAGVHGYRAMVREELAATVQVSQAGKQRFTARVVMPDGRDTTFSVAGDELYVDARILKWKPLLNLLGLHTVYRLDRVGGRYTSLKDEENEEHTMYSLDGEMLPWDLFLLRKQCRFLAPIVDAQYGSAAFTPVKGRNAVRITVTTSGLMARTDN